MPYVAGGCNCAKPRGKRRLAEWAGEIDVGRLEKEADFGVSYLTHCQIPSLCRG